MTAPSPFPKRGFTVKEAARYLGCSVRKVEEGVAAGTIPHRILFSAFAPDRFTRGRRGKGRVIITIETLDELINSAPEYGSLNPAVLKAGAEKSAVRVG